MKITTKIILAAALAFASAPAFAHGGGMGGSHVGEMGGQMGGTGNVGGHNGKVTFTSHDSKTTHTQHEIIRIDRELARIKELVIKLENTGHGNSRLAIKLRQQFIKLSRIQLQLES